MDGPADAPADRPGDCVVAVDVGGTVIKGGVIDAEGRLLTSTQRPTLAASGPGVALEQTVAAARDLLDRVSADGRRAAAVGVTSPGIVDEAAGRVVFSANIGWRELSLRDAVAARLPLPVTLSHDVRAGGLAEELLGAGRGCRDFLFLPIGTGIAGALVLGGRPYPGGRGHGGEIGHMSVEPGGRPCRCGGRGCLEAIASAAAIADRYGETAGERIPAEQVIARAEAGDADAVRVWSSAVTALAAALAAYCQLLDPQRVVIGGGLAGAGAALFEPLAEHLEERLTLHSAPELVPAALGDRAGCLGAGIAAWQALGHRIGAARS